MAPPQGGACDFWATRDLIGLTKLPGTLDPHPVRAAEEFPRFAPKPRVIQRALNFTPSRAVTAVTATAAFGVDFSLVQTYSQAQGEV